ncbi:MAG TPA: purine phosphoribosyltransferase family protein [Methanoculleus sp.]|nr:purine phosphoribosyltransferase family protein [Methanoculleus sp.]
MLELLKQSLLECPVVRRGEYNYFIHPITDGIPNIDPALLREVACAMIRILNLDGVNKIVTAEAMGIHIGTSLSLMTDIPLNVMRKRSYSLPSEIAVHQSTGYSKGELYLNGIVPGDRVVIIDDVCSTGGTMVALIDALTQAGAEVADICVAVNRCDPWESCPYKSLVSIDVTGSGVHITGSYF